ncbi:hypothetical protein [Microbispora hainanensis]|nr:hypothetical protein [Microbispora hainanensis]
MDRITETATEAGARPPVIGVTRDVEATPEQPFRARPPERRLADGAV